MRTEVQAVSGQSQHGSMTVQRLPHPRALHDLAGRDRVPTGRRVIGWISTKLKRARARARTGASAGVVQASNSETVTTSQGAYNQYRPTRACTAGINYRV